MAFDFSLQSVSKCRNLLMDYAILGVLVGHIISFGDVESFGFINAILWLSGLVHTIDIPVYGIGFILQRLFGIILVCLVFKILMDNQTIYLFTIFNWLGKYTFELYILHLYYWFIIKGICNYGEMFNIVTAVLLSVFTCVPVHKLIEYIVSLVRRKKRLCI